MRKLYIDVIPAIKTLDITTRTTIGGELLGGYKSVFRGKGLEFEDYAEYTEGDDASMIDWKASIRSNNLLIKRFVEERNLNIFFLVDVSSSMVYSSSVAKLKSEFAAEIIISLSYLMIKHNDKVSMALFNDGIVNYVPPGQGPAQFYNIVSNLVNPQNYGGDYDLGKGIEFAINYTKRKGLLFILSDFIGLKKGWDKILALAANKFEVGAFMILDPADIAIPETDKMITLRDPFYGTMVKMQGTKLKQKYEEGVKKQIKAIETLFLDYGGDFLRLNTNEPFLNPLISFFNARKLKR